MLFTFVIIAFFCIGVFFKPKELSFIYCVCSPIIYHFPTSETCTLISLCILGAYFVHSGRLYSWQRNVFFVTIILQFFSIFVSNYLSAYPHNGLAFRLIASLTTVFVVGHYLLNASEAYLKFCIKVLKILCVFVFIDAVIELVTLRNPFNELMLSLGIYDKSKVATYIDIRYGLKRCQSVFGMKTTLGGFGMILFGVFVYARYIGRIRIHQAYIWMCVIMTFISGTRSVMAGFVVIGLMLCTREIRRQLGLVQITACVVALLLFLGNYLLSILDSFSSTDSVSGSSSEMRRNQFELALFYMRQNLVFGNGLSFSWVHVVARYAKEALGLESIWLPIMIDRGVFGCLAYASLYLAGIRNAIKSSCPIIMCVYVAWLIANSMSSLPGLNEIFYMPMFLLLHAIGKKCCYL